MVQSEVLGSGGQSYDEMNYSLSVKSISFISNRIYYPLDLHRQRVDFRSFPVGFSFFYRPLVFGSEHHRISFEIPFLSVPGHPLGDRMSYKLPTRKWIY